MSVRSACQPARRASPAADPGAGRAREGPLPTVHNEPYKEEVIKLYVDWIVKHIQAA